MDDEELEKHLRNHTTTVIKRLKLMGWREDDIDFDDGEVRIVLTHQEHSGVSITLMLQME